MTGFDNLSKQMKRLREERGWSQMEFGERAGVHQSVVSRWETRCQASIQNVNFMLAALNREAVLSDS